MNLSLSAVATLLIGTMAAAEVPRVIVDTFPLHSLTAQVMAGVGAPELLLVPGTSPHDFALRPSDAQRLADADLVIWTGPGFVPWLAEALPVLAPEAAALTLLGTTDWPALPLRDDPRFAQETGDAEGQDATVSEADATATVDPHAWLDPAVAAVWGASIAEALAAADPENADRYRANAAAQRVALGALTAGIGTILDPARRAGNAYLVSHDAYQYFEVRFALPAAGAIALSDANAPGPARIAELRDRVRAGEIACILADPETAPALTTLLGEGTDARIVTVDPDAIFLTPGPDLYGAMMRQMAEGLAGCLE